MNMEVDKVDMSLDDIIKLNKKQGTRGRGGASRGGRGGRGARGGRGGTSRGAGQITSRTFVRGGATKVRGRGPNNFANLQRGRGGVTNVGVSPLNRTNYSSSPNKRGRGGSQTRGRGESQTRGRGIQGRRGQGRRGGGARGGQLTQQTTPLKQTNAGFTSLNKRRMQAIDSLIKAKNTLAQLNAKQREQQTLGRAMVVNQKRGLQVSPTQSRGRGRGRRGNLSRFGSTVSINSVGTQQSNLGGLSQFGSTVSLNSVTSQKSRGRGRGRGRGNLNRQFGSTVSLNSIGIGGGQNKQRKKWRTPKADVNDQLLTVSVKNSPKPQKQRNRLNRYSDAESDPSLQAQIASLKPAVSQKYNFKMAVFAQASTSTSLSERFGATPGVPTGKVDAQGRKVFF